MLPNIFRTSNKRKNYLPPLPDPLRSLLSTAYPLNIAYPLHSVVVLRKRKLQFAKRLHILTSLFLRCPCFVHFPHFLWMYGTLRSVEVKHVTGGSEVEQMPEQSFRAA